MLEDVLEETLQGISLEQHVLIIVLGHISKKCNSNKSFVFQNNGFIKLVTFREINSIVWLSRIYQNSRNFCSQIFAGSEKNLCALKFTSLGVLRS